MLNKLSLRWIFIIGWAGLSLPAAAATAAKSPKPKPAATQQSQAVQAAKQNAAKQAVKPATAKGTIAQAQAASPISGVKFQSTNRRDPFLDLTLLNKNAQRQEDEEVSRGQAPPGIAGMFIAQVKLQGISIREGSQLAVFRGSDNRAYFLQEGDKLFDGFVKKINTDSVLLIRETKLRSGKELSQEITKQLRTP
jgi:hypothetical protein